MEDHENFTNDYKQFKGGIRFDAVDDEDVDDEDNLYGGYYADDNNKENTLANMYAETTGGAKLEEDDNTYTIAHSSTGYTGGRYVSKTASGAAKKAGTTIFKSMKGSKKPVRSGNTDKTIHEAFVVLERTRQGKCKKYYAYELEHILLGTPKVVTIKYDKNGNKLSGKNAPELKYNYKTTAKKAELPDEFVELNKEAKKKYAAAKKVQKAKENGEVPKPKRKTPAAAKKPKKAPAPKNPKKTTAAKDKADTVDKILKSIVAQKKKAPKQSPKKRAAPKKKTGGGYCSFF